MSFDVKSFRRALGCFATGITVVTTAGKAGEPGFGITVNSLTSVSLEPPLVLFCLQRSSRYFEALTETAEFGVTILAETQAPLSMHFATSATQSEWTGLEVVHTDLGTPLPAAYLGQLVCRRHAVHDGGDHAIVVGEVTSFVAHPEAPPLLYFRGRYGRLGELFVPGPAA